MKKPIAEFVGTFTLVFFGCGAAVIAGMGTGPTAINVGQLWLFIVAPAIGAAIAGLLFKKGAVLSEA